MATDAHPAASSHRGGRANRPGSRWAYLATGIAAIAAAVIVVLLMQGGGSRGGTLYGMQTSSTYGHPPAWETIPEPAAVKTVAATSQAPVLNAMEGYPVEGKLNGGSVDVNADGPAVPTWAETQGGDGELKSGQDVPGTFELTFTNATGTVPLSAGQFTVINYMGQITHPRVTNANGGPIPPDVTAGHSVRLKLATSVPEGDGAVRWSPNGDKILVSYFWTLELS